MSGSSNRPELYRRAFEQSIREHKDLRLHPERGREFLFVARELLTIPEDVERVARKLAHSGIANERGRDFGGVARLVLPRNPDDVPAIVRLLRDPRQWPGERVPFVQPHHAVVGHGGNMHGHPGQPPHVAAPLPDPAPGSEARGKGVVVGVVDTGISRTAATDHPQWLGGAFLARSEEVDAAYAHDDVFALQGGHGTFVAGVVRQAAPGARLDPEKALDPSGLGTEEDLVRALSSFDERVQVVNLSLGCFTQDDVAPEPVRRAVHRLAETAVVVASAGNQGTHRPSWPAALPRVVAVAAVAQERDGSRAPACYSNSGHWVDACAVGNRTSTYLRGRWALPGDPVVDAYDRWAYWLGTSFAAPHVSGRIAETMTTHGLSAFAARDLLLAGTPFFPGYGILVD
ncbi:S8 family peptidase [Saccharothrix algeriensis]|uniref:S8 family serine peptidase n=1 Tax=Saccharothrix algeriensis TaxID=173560 RepID=A0A8T8HV81_9PSEU|nr:S8 family serine peptidase [Saccharothrix algeriensis]MBM7813872.1 subtilisin family serine protease [Saccharothrix algeriensis]QTR02307.1 S8 family serine peptidase [Saccharothrix algeriensis]